MKKRGAMELHTCKEIFRHTYPFGFNLSDEKGPAAKRYKEVKDAIKAYLKKHTPEEGSILVYRSRCLDPQIGGWYDPNRTFRYHKAAYLVTFDQLLHISDLKGDKHTATKFYKISSRKVEEVSYEALIAAWYKEISPETKKKWLEKVLEEMLFSKVIDNPLWFL